MSSQDTLSSKSKLALIIGGKIRYRQGYFANNYGTYTVNDL